MTEMIVPTTMRYFYGWITREKAEFILQTAGCQSGLYLLRESNSNAGQYVLSLCHLNRVHHYSIERQPSGCVKIQEGISFPGPIELVNHHKRNLDGLLTKLTAPCDRPTELQVMAWPNVTYLDLEEHLLAKAKKMGLKNAQLCNAFSHQRQHLKACVAQELHLEQPWFHGPIERAQADDIMKQCGHSDGRFLVREKSGGYVLSLSYKSETKHYKIDRIMDDKERLAIESGPRFDNLMDMIAYYHNKTQGLLCKLLLWYDSVDWPQRLEKMLAEQNKNMDPNPGYIPMPLWSPDNNGEVDDDDMLNAVVPCEPCDLRRVPSSIFNMDSKNLKLHKELGSGNFGSVLQGTYKLDYDVIPVAIKKLKKDNFGSEAEKEIMKEAEVMANLRHENILRMFGVCRTDTVMLVLELAPCGPLHKYLKAHMTMSVPLVLDLMMQVARGMSYLESRNFVHRDLAARNVLLVREDLAKIADFGMSKALGLDKDYYKATMAGKWPLKWYAPECIYYHKFDSSSDVWSYGVTLWEALTYGQKPYRGMKGDEILTKIDAGYRLEQPLACSDSVYTVMRKCWSYSKKDRPNFDGVLSMLMEAASR